MCTSTARPTRPPTRTSSRRASSPAAAHGSSSRSTSATRSACASTASASSRSPSSSRPSASPARTSSTSSPASTRSRRRSSKDTILTKEDALRDIYRKLRPGEQVAAEAARALLDNFYFNPKRYDLAKVGRYKINQKLGLDAPLSDSVLTVDDIVATIKYLVRLHRGDTTFEGLRDGKTTEIRLDIDDIDNFGNRRIRAVGELIQNQVRTGLSRMERVVRERMTTQDIEAITPQTLINVRPVVAAIKEFFGTSQLSQFMDQNNPLAGLTHKRRLSALGPGGLSRERAGVEVRDVHPSHYGRMCPIETPEGPNIGLIGSLASFARINAFGFIETPYRKVVDGKVTEQIDYLTAIGGETTTSSPRPARRCKADGHFAEDRVLARRRQGGEVDLFHAGRDRLHGRLAAPDGVGRDLAHPVPRARRCEPRPHGCEHAASGRSAAALASRRSSARAWRASPPSTRVTSSPPRRPASSLEVSADVVTVQLDEGGTQDYFLRKFDRSNQGT